MSSVSMPDAPLRPCLGGCGTRVPGGRCAACTRQTNTARRLARVFDYAASWWRRFRAQFFGRLAAQGIPAVCGATMPGGPDPRGSRCRAEGRTTGASDDGTGLHLHHEPELTEAEQRDRRAICNPLRIVVLCRSCHASETGAGRGEKSGAFE